MVGNSGAGGGTSTDTILHARNSAPLWLIRLWRHSTRSDLCDRGSDCELPVHGGQQFRAALATIMAACLGHDVADRRFRGPAIRSLTHVLTRED
jgi:hypothetical protein